MRIRGALSPLCLTFALLSAGPARADPGRLSSPEEVRAAIAATGGPRDFGGANRVVVLEESDVTVRKSGLAVTDDLRVVKVLRPEGVRALSVLREGFDPATNRVAFRSVRIHRKAGSVEEVPLDALVTQPSRQWLIFWGGKQHLVPIPRLEIGDALEIRRSSIGFNVAYLDDGPAGELDATGLKPPIPGHWHETVRFQGGLPVLKKRYAVRLPKEMPLQFMVCNGPLRTSLRFDGDHHVYTFEAEDIPPFEGEPGMVSRDDCVTKVVMATLGTWEEKSRWFFRVNEGQFAADDAIRKKVAKITEGLTEEQAIEACLHWVADNIRYVGTSRGPCEGFTLHRGIETFRDRGGVCKDIAGMLITMLRVLGHETYPALTMAGPRVEDVPADQFNHTVAVMRYRDGTFRVLDPTWSPVSKELWSSREALQGLVYGTPEGRSLTLSPYFPPEENRVRIVGRSEIGKEGDLESRLTFDLSGYGGTYMRRSLHRHPEDRRVGAVREALRIAPNAEVIEFSGLDPLDYSSDYEGEIRIESKGYAGRGAGLAFFRLPLLSHPLGGWLVPDLMSVSGPEKRKFGLRLRATRLIEYEGSILLPEGWEVAKLPKREALDSPSAKLLFEAKVEAGRLLYRLTLAAKNHIVPPADYPAFRKAIETVNRLAGEWIVCRTGKGGTDD